MECRLLGAGCLGAGCVLGAEVPGAGVPVAGCRVPGCWVPDDGVPGAGWPSSRLHVDFKCAQCPLEHKTLDSFFTGTIVIPQYPSTMLLIAMVFSFEMATGYKVLLQDRGHRLYVVVM